MRLYLSSSKLWNSTYSTPDGTLLFKAACDASPASTSPSVGLHNHDRLVKLYRALPDITLPTSERQLWEERHFFETHPSTHRDHPELDGQGSGLPTDELIFEEDRAVPGEHDASAAGSSVNSLYEYPLSVSGRSSFSHGENHPYWTKEHWVHFADIDFKQGGSATFNIAGREFSSDELFEKTLGSRSRIFTLPSGERYKWDLLHNHLLKLYLLSTPSGHPELVADFQPSCIAVSDSPSSSSDNHTRKTTLPPTLTIRPKNEDMADMIIITLIYSELQEAGAGFDGRPNGPRMVTWQALEVARERREQEMTVRPMVQA